MTRRLALPLLAAAVALTGCADACKDSGTMCVVAGTGSPGVDAETRATRTGLYGPMDVAAISGPDDFAIGDWNNHRIRRVQDGHISTLVGTDFLGDGDPDFEERIEPGVAGTEVALNHPTQLEVHPDGDRILLPSWHNHRIREYDLETGNSLVVCANTAIDDGNGANAGFAGDGGPAEDALMAFPMSIAIDPDTGDFWFVAARNERVRFVTADYSFIDTIAGNGEAAYTGDGGDPLEASFYFWDHDDLQPEPAGAIEYDPERELLYVADTSNHAIRVIDLGANTIDSLDTGVQSAVGPNDACDTEALCFPRDVELGPDGLLYVADANNHVIRTIDPDSGAMEVVAGTFEAGEAEDGVLATEGGLEHPHGIDITDDGTLLIADTYNHVIRKVTP